PDGRAVAFVREQDVHIASSPVRSTDATASLDASGPQARRLTTTGGMYPHWRDAGTLEFTDGRRYFAYHVATGRIDSLPLRLRLPRHIGRGSIALTGARVVTLANRKVLEGATV